MPGENYPSSEIVARNIQIICGALIAGVVIAGILMVSMRLSGASGENDTQPSTNSLIEDGSVESEMNPLILVPLGGFVITFPLAMLMPFFLNRGAVGRNSGLNEEAALRVANATATTATIIRFAILEGTAFFSILVFFISGSWIALLPAFLCLAAMLALFPGRPDFLRSVTICSDK